MKSQNNLAFKPIAYCLGALIIGGIIGVYLIAPALEGQKQKKQQTLKPGQVKT